MPEERRWPFDETTWTLCPSGLRGWTQVPLAQAARVQIPQVSFTRLELALRNVARQQLWWSSLWLARKRGPRTNLSRDAFVPCLGKILKGHTMPHKDKPPNGFGEMTNKLTFCRPRRSTLSLSKERFVHVNRTPLTNSIRASVV